MGLTAEQAIELLRSHPSDYTTSEALRGLISQLDVSGSGSGTTTLLYSGAVNKDLSSWDVAQNIAANNSDIRIVDKTEAAKFLDLKNNPELLTTLEDVFGVWWRPFYP